MIGSVFWSARQFAFFLPIWYPNSIAGQRKLSPEATHRLYIAYEVCSAILGATKLTDGCSWFILFREAQKRFIWTACFGPKRPIGEGKCSPRVILFGHLAFAEGSL